MVVLQTELITPNAGLERVLTSDPGMGILRHADAGTRGRLNLLWLNDINIPLPPQQRD